MDFSDFRCVRCDAGGLTLREGEPDPGEIARGALVCPACGAAYDLLWGMPFFGSYETHDILGLLEIAAGAGLEYEESGAAFVAYQEALHDYHTAADRGTRAQPSIHRYTEWFILETLIHDLDLAGKDVLDVGAGRGYDSARLAHAGARVTALEYSPVLMRQGLANLPEARWVGGFSHLLPFRDGSFDYIFCNAALHHMRDIPRSVEEMLRVLRPGGALLTISDAYSPSSSTQADELAYFGSHPDVLGGVNERLPPFGEFARALAGHRDKVDPKVFAFIQRAPESLFPGFKGEHGCYLRRWDFDRDADRLARTHGVVNLRVELTRPLGLPAATQEGPGLLSAGEYSQWLDDSARAIASLASVVPPELCNIPFPGPQDKFFLLNGWRIGEPAAGQRELYRRGRWFFRAGSPGQCLHLEAAVPYSGWDNGAVLEAAVNARVIWRRELARGMWHRLCLPLAEAEVGGDPFCLELRLRTASAEWADNLLRVRRLELAPAETPDPPGPGDLFDANLEAWCDLRWRGRRRGLRVLFWPSPELTARVINLLRSRDLETEAVVARGQEDFLAWQPGARLAGAYPDPNLHGTNSALEGPGPDLIAAPGPAEALALAGMCGAAEDLPAVLHDGRTVAVGQLRSLQRKSAAARAILSSGPLRALAMRLPESWHPRLRRVAERLRGLASRRG